MAAMKPRTGEGPLEVTKEGRGLVMRVPLEGGGRLVVELSPDEAQASRTVVRPTPAWTGCDRRLISLLAFESDAEHAIRDRAALVLDAR
jgi:hypothetical protein